jgi:diacylglycerol kinase (ATP)
VATEAAGRLSVPAMLARLLRGSHVGQPDARVWRARRVRIATGGRSPVIADSTNLGSGPVDLQVLPGALKLVLPAR